MCIGRILIARASFSVRWKTNPIRHALPRRGMVGLRHAVPVLVKKLRGVTNWGSGMGPIDSEAGRNR